MSPSHHHIPRFLPYPHPPQLPPQHCSIKCQPGDRSCCRKERCTPKKSYVYPLPPPEYVVASSKASHSPPRTIHREKKDMSNSNVSECSTKENEPNCSIDMLTRLFPQHPVLMLKNVLSDCKDDTVQAIEKILDRFPADAAEKELFESQMTRSRSFSPSNIDPASPSDRRNIGINDDQLSSLARAYDIPVMEEKLTSSKRSIYQW